MRAYVRSIRSFTRLVKRDSHQSDSQQSVKTEEKRDSHLHDGATGQGGTSRHKLTNLCIPVQPQSAEEDVSQAEEHIPLQPEAFPDEHDSSPISNLPKAASTSVNASIGDDCQEIETVSMPARRSTFLNPFYLTNNSEKPPHVHGVFNPTTSTWQYVVADPVTSRCVMIDPMNDKSDQASDALSKSADRLFDLVQQNNYLVDHIFETHSSQQKLLSAAWGLRMRLHNTQGYAPEVCSGETVIAMQQMFARKYGSGSGFNTTLAEEYNDGQRIKVGNMRVVVMHVPGHGTPKRCAYLIGGNVFGVHSLADLKPEDANSTSHDDDDIARGAVDEARSMLLASMRKILSLPEATRVYYEESNGNTEDENACVPPSTTIEQCRAANEYIDLGIRDFLVRRQGEFQLAHQQKEAANTTSKRVWGFRKKKGGKGEGQDRHRPSSAGYRG